MLFIAVIFVNILVYFRLPPNRRFTQPELVVDTFSYPASYDYVGAAARPLSIPPSNTLDVC